MKSVRQAFTGAICTLLAGLLLAPMAGLTQELPEFSAYYEAKTNGMRGEAERHLIRKDDGSYRLNVSLEASMVGVRLGELEQSSEFELTDERLVPQKYTYVVSGITSSNDSVDFDWENGTALSQEDEQSWQLELGPHTLDQLSYQLALAMTLRAGDWAAEDVFEFELVDGDELEIQRYRLLGEEVTETPLGRLNTVKLERIREDDSGRATNIWFAKDWHYLLTTIEQVTSSGLRIELALENAKIANAQVTPLPDSEQ